MGLTRGIVRASISHGETSSYEEELGNTCPLLNY